MMERIAIRGVSSFILIVWSIIVILPLVILFSVALKSSPELLHNALGWPKHIQWNNFNESWQKAHLTIAFLNSLIVTACTLLGLVTIGSAAAYPLARRKSRYTNAVYIYFISGIMVPFQLAMIPLYKLMTGLKLMNTYPGAIFIYVAMLLPFVIFLYTGFLKTVPKELEEAALIDGCGPYRTFWTIIFPLMKPVTATVIITNALSIWNDFLVPLLFLQEKSNRTIPLAIFTFTGQYNNNWSMIFSCIILSSLPLILTFLLLQKHFIKGIAGGAIKG